MAFGGRPASFGGRSSGRVDNRRTFGSGAGKLSEKPLGEIGGRWTEAELVAMIPDLLAARSGAAAGADAYAGIGSRETPPHILAEMRLSASVLEQRGFRMRSGGAGGADTAFDEGVSSKANKDVILPWRGFSGIQHGVMLPRHLEAQAEALALKYHSAPAHLFEDYGQPTQKAKPALKLHTRNTPQVLGLDLKTPAKLVICYTPDGAASGGTGQAIRIAEAFGVPVLNLRRPAIREAVLAALGVERQREMDSPVRDPVGIAREAALSRAATTERPASSARSAFDLEGAVRPKAVWLRSESAVFFKVRDENGALSNMANGHPYEDGGVRWGSSEAQYQAMRFPHREDIQEMIHAAKTAMDSKVIAREFASETRPDWNEINVEAMAYVITRKRDSAAYVAALDATEGRPIVEQSSRDDFWGAKGYEERLIGQNVLGRLQVQSREGARQDDLPRGTTLPTPERMAELRRDRLVQESGVVAPEAAPASARVAESAGSVSYVRGDVAADRADVIVNTVNARLSERGNPVMGKGVALSFKERFPSIMRDYERAIRSGELREGRTMLFDLPDGRKWAAMATKADWRDPSRMEWVDSALKELAERTKALGLNSVALPPPGCGNGGLDWKKVEPLVHRHLEGLDLVLYAEPSGAVMPKETASVGSAPKGSGVSSPRTHSAPSTPGRQVETREAKAPSIEATMYFSYGRDRRPGVRSASTFEAILAGERTSTTRFDSWNGSDRWGSVQPGTVVRMFEDKDKQGRFVDVRVSSVERIDLASASPERMEEWSRAEGWSAEHGRQSGRRNGAGWQVRYEPVPGQEILRAREMVAPTPRTGSMGPSERSSRVEDPMDAMQALAAAHARRSMGR